MPHVERVSDGSLKDRPEYCGRFNDWLAPTSGAVGGIELSSSPIRGRLSSQVLPSTVAGK